MDSIEVETTVLIMAVLKVLRRVAVKAAAMVALMD
jgi:hypothetical protein